MSPVKGLRFKLHIKFSPISFTNSDLVGIKNNVLWWTCFPKLNAWLKWAGFTMIRNEFFFSELFIIQLHQWTSNCSEAGIRFKFSSLPFLFFEDPRCYNLPLKCLSSFRSKSGFVYSKKKSKAWISCQIDFK